MNSTTSLLIFILLVSFGCSNRVKNTNESQEKNLNRIGWVIKVKPEKLDEYKKLHVNPWPEVNAMLKECNIQNYSIFYRDGLLFSYLEYTGTDFDADMAKMAADSITREWWKLTDPCQEPVESAEEGVWWADLEEVFHLD
ncbi:L-rhamnose mutarotase [Prolixibacteraceae bacterium Z1-6]|uniref:L-rhamnose mutarotase n=1 Tax=Draconibacterium aestuarii TaxID=2998507 RepID=A0A9X3JA76_9BACT|nr:L-rhamnose mutarotase [Prolixibacteraceae bacterium Z1-6]